jgi:hypothetical protein
MIRADVWTPEDARHAVETAKQGALYVLQSRQRLHRTLARHADRPAARVPHLVATIARTFWRSAATSAAYDALTALRDEYARCHGLVPWQTAGSTWASAHAACWGVAEQTYYAATSSLPLLPLLRAVGDALPQPAEAIGQDVLDSLPIALVRLRLDAMAVALPNDARPPLDDGPADPDEERTYEMLAGSDAVRVALLESASWPMAEPATRVGELLRAQEREAMQVEELAIPDLFVVVPRITPGVWPDHQNAAHHSDHPPSSTWAVREPDRRRMFAQSGSGFPGGP